MDNNDEDDYVMALMDVVEKRIAKAEKTSGYKDWDFIEKPLIRMRPNVQDNPKRKERWSNLVARFNKMRYN